MHNRSPTLPMVAVVGCGYWGRNLVRNFAELGALAAVCDTDPDTASRYARQFAVAERSLDSVLDDPGIEAVAIATPAVTHANLVRRALNSGKHVFVEKPVALDVAEAVELKKLSEKESRLLMVGHLLQYHPAFQKLLEIVREGKLGSLQYIYSHRLNLGKIRREENILWSFAPHDISMILSLMGELPEKVVAVSNCILDREVADITTTHLSFRDGRSAHIFVSWLHPYKEQKLVVAGEKCMAVFNDMETWRNKLQLYPHSIDWQQDIPVPNKGNAKPVPVEEKEPLQAEAGHFLECIKSDIACLTGGSEAVNVLKVLAASEQSARAMSAIAIDE